MVAWVEADEMPPPPMSKTTGRPIRPKSHQAKLAFLDIEFLGWPIDPNLITEVGVWLAEEPAPVTWKIRPNPDYLAEIERNNPELWTSIQKAAEVNGFTQEAWADAPHWMDARLPIAQTIYKRRLVGVNVFDADIKRLSAMFHPWDKGWIAPHTAYDLQPLARFLGHESVKLDALCEAYGIEGETIHTAEGGVRRVRAVAEKMLRRA